MGPNRKPPSPGALVGSWGSTAPPRGICFALPPRTPPRILRKCLSANKQCTLSPLMFYVLAGRKRPEGFSGGGGGESFQKPLFFQWFWTIAKTIGFCKGLGGSAAWIRREGWQLRCHASLQLGPRHTAANRPRKGKLGPLHGLDHQYGQNLALGQEKTKLSKPQNPFKIDDMYNAPCQKSIK